MPSKFAATLKSKRAYIEHRTVLCHWKKEEIRSIRIPEHRLDDSLIFLWCVAVYPASVYIILFGLSLAPFVDLLPGSQGRVKIYKDKAGTVRYGTVRYGTVRYGTVRYGIATVIRSSAMEMSSLQICTRNQLGERVLVFWGVDTRVVGIRITSMRIRIQIFPFMRILIWLFTLTWIRRILLLIKMMRICDHGYTDLPGLHFEHPTLQCELPQPSMAPYWASKAS